MKNLVKKTIIIMLGSFILSNSSNLFVTAFASEQLLPISIVDFKNTDQPTQPRWWPGNPNPAYGSEDWLFQNYGYNYGSSAPVYVAEGCGLSAVIGGVIGGSASLFYTWWMGGPITLGVFVGKFGAAAGTSYAACLVENGIKK